MNQTHFSIADLKQFQGKHVVVYWEIGGQTFVGTSRKIILDIKDEKVRGFRIDLIWGLRIYSVTNPCAFSHSLRRTYDIIFTSPSMVTDIRNKIRIDCNEGYVIITNDPNEHTFLSDLLSRYFSKD